MIRSRLSKIPLTLHDYLAFNRSALKNIMTLRMLPKVAGGAATTNVVILDLECEQGAPLPDRKGARRF